MKIVVLDGYTLNPGDNPWNALETLGELVVYDRTSPDEFLERAWHADVLLTNKTPINRKQIEKLPNLKFISVLATGYNVVDIVAARERNIPVSNVPIYGTETVAQHVMALILELTNHVGEHARSVAEGEWGKCPDFCYTKKSIIELHGLTLGVVGFGRIGQRVAEIADAFGMEILYSTHSHQKNVSIPATQVTEEELFSKADIITLHCKQEENNYQFVNKKLLKWMKPTAFLINTARGTLIHEDDLARALEEGRIAGVALDVLSKEPPNPENPLLHAPRCLITPHNAWSSLSARKRLMQMTAENVRSFLQGVPVHCVNGFNAEKDSRAIGRRPS